MIHYHLIFCMHASFYSHHRPSSIFPQQVVSLVGVLWYRSVITNYNQASVSSIIRVQFSGIESIVINLVSQSFGHHKSSPLVSCVVSYASIPNIDIVPTVASTFVVHQWEAFCHGKNRNSSPPWDSSTMTSRLFQLLRRYKRSRCDCRYRGEHNFDNLFLHRTQ